jgi:hypothetical protein
MNKITFLATNRNLTVGSYRIWIDDLSYYLKEIGIGCSITGDPSVALNDDSDIVICAKSDASWAPLIKKANRKKKIGVINLSADSNVRADFVIVGSIEEKISLSHHDHVFLYPLIERMFQEPSDYKMHADKERIRIGFHGSYTHLCKFDFGLKSALEKFEQKHNMELLVVTSNPSYQWDTGRPDIKNIIIKKWNHGTVKEDFLSCDIGIVPNVTNLDFKDLDIGTSVDLGLFNTDYILRFKNKSNAGRAFVFHQLGVPVVADITPSNIHILGNPKNGFVAGNSRSWLKGLDELSDYKKRQEIADSAKEEFDRLYSPLVWAENLYKNIKEI